MENSKNLQEKVAEGTKEGELVPSAAAARRKPPIGQRAFARLMQPHKGWILRRCLQRLGNHHDAQDCLQEVTLRVYRSLQTFRGDSQLSTWLYRITENQCNSYAARRSSHAISEHLEGMILIHEEMRHASNQHQHHQMEGTIGRVMDEMSPKSQQILRLRFFQDCSFEEISQDLQISLSAAKMRLYRALEDFRQRYLDVQVQAGNSFA